MKTQEIQKHSNNIPSSTILRTMTATSVLAAPPIARVESLVSSRPALKVGNHISIYWGGDQKWYDGYIVSIDSKETKIEVIYTDGELITEVLSSIDYKIIFDKPTKNITIKNKNSDVTYLISNLDGTVTAYKTPTQLTDSKNKKDRVHTESGSNSEAAAAAAAPSPKRYQSQSQKTLSEHSRPLLFSPAANSDKVSESPMTESETLRNLSKKLEDTKKELEQRKAQIETMYKSIGIQILQNQNEINSSHHKVIEIETTAINTQVQTAVGKIDDVSTTVINIVKMLNNLTDLKESLNQENKKVLLQSLNSAFGDLGAPSQLSSRVRTTLVSELDRLDVAIDKLKNTLSPSTTKPKMSNGS